MYKHNFDVHVLYIVVPKQMSESTTSDETRARLM